MEQRPSVENILSQLLLWDQPLSRLIQFVIFTLSSLQCILILLAYRLVFIANSDQDFFVDYLSKFCKMLSLIGVIGFERHEKVINAILIITALYILAFLTPFLLSLKQFWVDRKFCQGKNAFCIYFGLIHSGLGFWMLNALTMTFLNSGLNAGAATTIGCVVLVAVNYLLAFYFAVYSYDAFLGSNNVLSCHSRIFQIIVCGFKGIAAPLIFLTDSMSRSGHWTFSILSIILLGIGHFELMRSFPYYNYPMMKLAIVFSTCKVWIALMNFIALTEASNYLLSGKVLVYIEVPICSLVIRIMLDIFHRMVFSSFSSSQDLGSSSEIMRKIFGILYLMERTKLTRAGETKKYLNELRFFGVLNLEDNQRYLTEMNVDENEAMARILRGLLGDAVERFNKNQQLRIMRVDMMLDHSPFEVSMINLGELKKLQGGGARLITMKLNDKLQKRMTSFFKENRENILDLNRFLEYEAVSNNFNHTIQDGIKKYRNYWSAFLKPNLKIHNFFLKSKELEKIAQDIESQWEKAAGNDKYFAGAFCNAYSAYLSLLRASPFHSQIVQQKYSKIAIEQAIKVENNDDLLTNDSLFSPNILTIHASLTKENPGKILEVSSNFEELAGWGANDILGHNVDILMPPFMASSHKKLLLNHLKNLHTGRNSARVYTTLKSHIMHRSGYLLPCDVYLSLHPILQDSPVYLVFVRVKDEAGEQILLSEGGEIEGFTQKIGSLLDLKNKANSHYDTICANSPDIQIALEKLKQGKTSKISLKEKGIHFRLPQRNITQDYPVDISCHVFDEKPYFLLSLGQQIDVDEEVVAEEFSERTRLKSLQERVLSSPASNLEEGVQKMHFDTNTPRVTSAFMEDGLCSSNRNLVTKVKSRQIKEEWKDIGSSVGSSSKHSITKFERALNRMPKNPRVRLLYVSFLFLMTVSGVSLILFQQKVHPTLDQIHSSGEVISNLIFRLIRYTDVYSYARILWQANVGLTELDRYDQYGYSINTIDYNFEVMAEILEGIRERNEVIQNFVYRLDKRLFDQIYSDLVPVYEILANGSIVATREDNLFDLTTELVATGSKFLYSGMPFDENNPYLIFLINNTMNEPLLAGERELPILMDDNQVKLNDLSISTYIMISVTFGLAALIFVYFNNIVMKFIKERSHFLFTFTNIEEKYVQEHLRLLESFQATLNQTHNLTHTQPRQKSSNKKIVDKKGINRTLSLIYLALIVFLLGIWSVSPIMSILVKRFSKTILKKLDLMAQSNYIFYDLVYYWNAVNAYAQYGVYEYEYVKDRPIAEAIKAAAEETLGVQDFFIKDLLNPENGMSDNSFIYDTAVGNLCDLYSFSDEILESICPTLGDGAATKGIIGLYEYHIIALNSMQECYTQSNKTWEDSKRCLSLEEVVNIEVFYPYTYNSFNNIDILIREAMVEDYNQMEGFISGFMIGYIVLYLGLGGVVGWRIKQRLEEELTDWRKMMRQIPFVIANESKLMKTFLQKYRADI